MKENHYKHLVAMAALSFAAMYILMYAMVNAFGNVYNSVNQVYMAGLGSGATSAYHRGFVLTRPPACRGQVTLPAQRV